MDTLVNFLLWLWLAVASLWLIGLLLSVSGAAPGRSPLRQALPFTYTGPRRAVLFLGALSALPIQAIAWPLAALSSALGSIRVMRQVGLAASAEVRLDAVLRDVRSRHRPWSLVWHAVLAALALLALGLLPPAAGPALVGLLVGLWSAMLLWLLSLCLPGQHLGREARGYGGGRLLFFVGFAVLYALLFPAAGSAVVSLRAGQPPTLASLWAGVADTYSLGGVAFEGLKAAVPQLRNPSASIVPIATGLSLYAFFASTALRGLFSRTTTQDRLNMAVGKLLVDDAEAAQAILDVDTSDDTALWDLRAIALALGGRVDAAVEIVARKVPEVSGLLSTPSISAVGYLMIRLRDWRVGPAVRDELWVSLAKLRPPEDDLVALWLVASGASPSNGPAPGLIVKLGALSGFAALPWFAAALRTVHGGEAPVAERLSEADALAITSPCVLGLKAAFVAGLRSRLQQPGTVAAIDVALARLTHGVSIASSPGQYMVLLMALQLMCELASRTRHPGAAQFASLRQRATECVRLLPSGIAVGAIMASLRVKRP